MRNPAALILLLTTTGLIFSCKKDGIRPNEGTMLLLVRNSYEDGTISKRSFDRDASDKLLKFRDSSTIGWYETIVFEHDANGRISKANYKDQQGGVFFYYEFEYNPNGTVRQRQDQPGSINLANDIHRYGYDAAGHLVADSVFSWKSWLGEHTLSSINKFIYTGDNVTESEYYSFYTGSPGLEGRRKFEYDNAANPYKNVANYYSITSVGFAIDEAKYLSSNNVLKEYAADATGPYELKRSFKYQYNSSNYPWKYKVDLDKNQPWIVEAEFFYKQ